MVVRAKTPNQLRKAYIPAVDDPAMATRLAGGSAASSAKDRRATQQATQRVTMSPVQTEDRAVAEKVTRMTPDELRAAEIPGVSAPMGPINSPAPHRTKAGRAKQAAGREAAHLAGPQQDLPESGEAVRMPPARSTFNKPAVMSEEDHAQAADARAKRQAWEATPEGQARTRNMLDLYGEGAKGMSIRQVYGVNKAPTRDPGPVTGQLQLPGMADPHAAPRPARWEELSEANRSHTIKGLALHGTSIEQMIADYGAQIDQAHHRAWSAGAERPFSQEFYSVGEPRQKIKESAEELGIPEQIHGHMNAFTSPQTKFSQESRGETIYPNDRAAVHSVKFVQQGGDPAQLTNKLAATGGERFPGEAAQGYEKNMIRAAKSYKQYTEGVPPSEWVTGKGGEGPFDSAPKTGPYSNSWNDTHPQYFVSDVHSGGGGMVPHLSYDKKLPRDEEGNFQLTASGKKKGTDSEREQAIEKVPFFHAIADYAARQAHEQRGIAHVREGQAIQWGEEQLQRGEAGMRGAPKESDVYTPKVNNAQFHNVNQPSLFD